MASWADLAAANSRLAARIQQLFHQYGLGFGYLATVRRDGGPRVHPVSPIIADGAVFCFIMDSPKREDLERDGRYALHAYPGESTDDEAYLVGRARAVADLARRETLVAQYRAEPRVDWRLFEFDIEVAMFVEHVGRQHTRRPQIWRAPRPDGGA
jgi:pyridoxamine 5'-phosphate oxidase-like protein